MSDEKPKTGDMRTKTGRFLLEAAKLSAAQVLSMLCIASLGFICSLQAFQVYSEREERKLLARERQDATATSIRESNAQAELVRNHCSVEAKELRAFFAEQNERRMKFESEERAKDRAILVSFALRLEGIERSLTKKND